MSQDRVAGGRRASGTRLSRARLFALAVVFAVLGMSATAVASSGGTSAGGGASAPSAPRIAKKFALNGRGMWIWELSSSNHGDVSSIIAQARHYGLSAVIIKSSDGTSAWSQFNRSLVSTLHANGLKVCAWQYVYGNHPGTEAQLGAAAIKDGADCLMIDAESEYQGKYVQAQTYIQKLRSLIGQRAAVALAGFPYIDYHPSFPYSVFLGPGGAQYNAPQMYWKDIGTTVDAVYAHTYEFNRLYQRPIFPLGQVFDSPPRSQILRFRQISRAYGATGVSWWDWQQAPTGAWRAVARRVGALKGFEPSTLYATLSQGASGDVVVWSQEHLVSAGEQIAIDGGFGPKTLAAVQAFQSAHALPVTGVIDTATWQALLSYAPARVKWVSRHHRLTATSAAAGTSVVPKSASLPARRYEIPRSLGSGRR